MLLLFCGPVGQKESGSEEIRKSSRYFGIRLKTQKQAVTLKFKRKEGAFRFCGARVIIRQEYLK